MFVATPGRTCPSNEQVVWNHIGVVSKYSSGLWLFDAMFETCSVLLIAPIRCCGNRSVADATHLRSDIRNSAAVDAPLFRGHELGSASDLWPRCPVWPILMLEVERPPSGLPAFYVQSDALYTHFPG